MHIASAFSCTEIVDVIYNELMSSLDTFIMSKGHGCMIQYVILRERDVLKKEDLDNYCTSKGRLGCHPDYGTPGIAASTGSLGHGLAMAVGMAIADRSKTIYVVLSDGELQEGSTWEAVLMASSLGLTNIVGVIDNNDFQSLGRTSKTHPTLYPIIPKFKEFGWESTVAIDGHNSASIFGRIKEREGKKPFMLLAKTIKGKGVTFMKNNPLWHYRSPDHEQYLQAMAELS